MEVNEAAAISEEEICSGIPLLLKRLADELRKDGGQDEFLEAINGDELNNNDRQVLGRLCSVTTEGDANSELTPIAPRVAHSDSTNELPVALILGGKKTKLRRKKKTKRKKKRKSKTKMKRKNNTKKKRKKKYNKGKHKF